MQDLYPEVGIAGMLEVDPPYDTVVISQVMYECIAVETLRSLLANGETPFEDYYQPYGVSGQRFEADLDNNTVIVTLQAVEGDIVTIPNSFIRSLPDANGIRYAMTMLGVSLSAMPADLNLDAIKESIREIVLDQMGLETEIQEIVYGPITLLTHEQHKAVEAKRLSVKKTYPTNL